MRTLLKKLAPYKWGLCGVLLLVFLQSLADLQLPNFMANIVDRGLTTGDQAYILQNGLWMLLVALLGAACTIAASFLSSRIAMRFGNRLREEMFRKATALSMREFDRAGTATLITRTTNDVTQIQQVIIMMLRMVAQAPMMCIGGLIMALSKDVWLTLVLLVAMPVVTFVIFFITRRAIPLFRSMQKKIDRLNLVLRESLTGVRVIRAFNRTEHDRARFDDANRDITETAIRVNKIMAFLMPSMMLVLNFTALAVMYFGAVRVTAGAMQLGDLMAVSQYVMQIMFALIMLSMMSVILPRAEASADRINETLALQNSVVDPVTPQIAERRGEVEFRGVSYRYSGAQHPALCDVSFTARPGETVAIIGSTGAGKSTLLNLIPRFFDTTEGTVLVDGVDVREQEHGALRAKLGLTPQRALLFAGTVRENLRMAREDATDEELWHALSIAQADFVHTLPGGLDFEVAQGGGNLSGGQKQRLTIARSLVRRPEIYLFDDNFSALDYRTDAALRAALRREVADATVLIVAQRVSTVRYADRIIVLDEGRVAGIGTHDTLRRDCEVYREILRSQWTEEELA